MNRNIRAYTKESIKTQIAGADSYTIIKMLMQGALERLAKGRGCIERSDLEGKAENLSKANAIINALLESLDAKDDSEVINNLASLYDYMLSRITDASIEKSVEPIDEVMLLLREIKSAWDAIPYEEVKKALDIQAEMAS